MNGGDGAQNMTSASVCSITQENLSIQTLALTENGPWCSVSSALAILGPFFTLQ